MGILAILILFPILIALILLAVRKDIPRATIMVVSFVVMVAIAITLAVKNFGGIVRELWKSKEDIDFGVFTANGADLADIVGYIIIAGLVIMTFFVIVMGIKNKRFLAPILILAQVVAYIWFAITMKAEIRTNSFVALDNLSIVIILIVAIVGTLVCVFASSNIKVTSEGIKERSNVQFFSMFILMSGVIGLVICNNVLWMFFFWTVISVATFCMMTLDRSKDSIKISYRALSINLLGGISLLLAAIIMGYYFSSTEFTVLMEYAGQMMAANRDDPVINLIVGLFVFAALTKAAQLPFSGWLLKSSAMANSVPTLIQTATVTNAGVFLIIKSAPLLGLGGLFHIGPGFMAVVIGGLTFLLASFIAISQEDARKILTYSTISNMGLIVACAGVGTTEALWAAIVLLIVNSVTKAVLFTCLSLVERKLGSCNISDMNGLASKMPKVSIMMMIGIGAVFLAPFGIAVAKWAAIHAFAIHGNVWIILMLIFGMVASIFYWTRWLGHIVSVAPITDESEDLQKGIKKREWTIISFFAILTIALAVSLPFISTKVVIPYLGHSFTNTLEKIFSVLSTDNMLMMIVLVVIVIIVAILFYGKSSKESLSNCSEVEIDEDETSLEDSDDLKLSELLPEKKLFTIGLAVSGVVLALVFGYFTGVAILFIKHVQEGGMAS